MFGNVGSELRERAGWLNNSSAQRRMHSIQELLILGGCVVALKG